MFFLSVFSCFLQLSRVFHCVRLASLRAAELGYVEPTLSRSRSPEVVKSKGTFLILFGSCYHHFLGTFLGVVPFWELILFGSLILF